MPDMDSITDNGAPCLPKERHVMLAYMSILYLILYLHIYYYCFVYYCFFVKVTFTICQKKANAPHIMMVSPTMRSQRRFCNNGCCINSSLRASHKPCVTLAQL